MTEPPARLRALPAGGAVARAEMGHLVEARGAGIAVGGEAAFGFRHLHVRLRQFVEEARGDVRRPQPVHAPVGGEIDVDAPARARDPHMRQAPLLLEPGAALVVEGALVREQALLPARWYHGVE